MAEKRGGKLSRPVLSINDTGLIAFRVSSGGSMNEDETIGVAINPCEKYCGLFKYLLF